jgi:tetratricopeptide (TPR) repeat protein
VARVCILLAILAAGSAHVAAQDIASRLDPELERLRTAAAFEASGDYDRAERVLREVLRTHPSSLSALVSFERVLTLQHRLPELLPAIDALLEHDPTSVVGHQMRVRAFSALNREAELEDAAEAWIRATPRLETPYREIARIWRSRGDVERAIRVLERGRDRVGTHDALALELGDAYAQIEDTHHVVQEWSRAVGPRGEAFLLVQRRLANLRSGGAAVIPGLVDALAARPATPARLKASLQLAVDGGLHDRAVRVARLLLNSLPTAERPILMIELGRRADGAGLDALALWAYSQVIDMGGRSDLMLALRSRVAELALALGDTTRANSVYALIEREFAPGSPERRQAMSLRVQVLAREAAWDSARAEFARLSEESNGTPEFDAAAASLANALIDAGRTGDAEDVLGWADGPHASFARGRVYMTRGEVDRARDVMLAAAPRLDGAEATEALSLVTLLGRLSLEGGTLLGRGVAALAEGDRKQGVLLLYEGSAGLPELERAAILDFAASLADRTGLAAEAEQMRREIVEDAPHSPEAPQALLALARQQLVRKQGPEEARLLLERLIVEYPRSALVPQAQRELERLAARQPER